MRRQFLQSTHFDASEALPAVAHPERSRKSNMPRQRQKQQHWKNPYGEMRRMAERREMSASAKLSWETAATFFARSKSST